MALQTIHVSRHKMTQKLHLLAITEFRLNTWSLLVSFFVQLGLNLLDFITTLIPFYNNTNTNNSNIL